MKRELIESVKMMIGFMPWILFLFIGGNSLSSLERAILICLGACLVFGFSDLRRGFLLAWGSLSFFVLCAILINGFKVLWLATYMSILANAYLALIMWLTIFLKNPFTLQYARSSLPEELWHDDNVFKVCQFIALVWGCLILASTAISTFKFTHKDLLPEWVYTNISIGIMISGVAFTAIYRHIKKKQRTQKEGIHDK
jgi:carotenoid cleavage dioxygenase